MVSILAFVAMQLRMAASRHLNGRMNLTKAVSAGMSISHCSSAIAGKSNSAGKADVLDDGEVYYSHKQLHPDMTAPQPLMRSSN